MNVLMFEIPTTERDGSVPFGVLYAASSAYRAGHNVRIVDLVKNPLKYTELKTVIDEFKPGLIGMGGITSSYGLCKELVRNIKQDFPVVPVVAGGVLSSVADLLIESAGVDYVVHGEGEETLVKLIASIESGLGPDTVNGISFLLNGKIHTTAPQTQIDQLDRIPLPEFKLLAMDQYLESSEKWAAHYFGHDQRELKDILDRIDVKKNFFPVVTARGCTHRCIFCYRHQKGWRQHSVRYVIDMMRYLRDIYNVGVVQFADELTTGNRAWVIDFCETLIREKLGVSFVILSSRVDTVDEEMLLLLKRAGCLMINYGYESGSDPILKEIRKGANRQKALTAGLLTKKAGLKNIPEIIIGFPSENDQTVKDTIDFLQKLNTWPISINTPIPFPETVLWDLAVKKNLITDKEKFIMGYRRGIFLNFTNFSDRMLFWWVYKVGAKTRLYYHMSRREYGKWLILLLKYQARHLITIILPAKTLVSLRYFLINLLRNKAREEAGVIK